jgi:hypothetical protein
MMARARGKPGRAARRALLWALASFVLAQVPLVLALFTSWQFRDPEYGLRLMALRARLAEREPGRPLVLFLGSSRTGVNVKPRLFATNDRAGTRPVVYNFGLCNAGPVQELLGLRRLLAEGIRPDVPLIDARDWCAAEDFHDGFHLTHAGTAAFTRRLERELGPCLAGQPFEQRWPAGRRESLLRRPGLAAK